MTSTAISAQGSTLKIATGSGSALTPTAVAVGFPTIITKSAHGLVAGDVVTLAGFTGADAALLNGLTLSIRDVTTNTFAVEVDTTGKTITVTGTPTITPVAWTQVNNIKTFTGFDGQASEIDVTNLSSTAKEYRLGLVDPGHFTLELDQDNSDAGQTAMRTAQSSGAVQQFKLTLPNSNTATFSGFVKKFSSQGGVDQVVKVSAEMRISGTITWA